MHLCSINGALVNSEDPDKVPKCVQHLVGLLSSYKPYSTTKTSLRDNLCLKWAGYLFSYFASA